MPLPKNPKQGRSRRIGTRLGETVTSEATMLELLRSPCLDPAGRFQKLTKKFGCATMVGDLEFRKDLEHGVRSKWEANFARWLKHHGLAYDYELCSFPITETCEHYLPDFRIGVSGVFVEVKGLWMPGAKRKVTCFIREYPDERILVLDKDYYRMLTPVGGWEK